MEENKKRMIIEMAEDIRRKIKGGTIFGEIIDFDNQDMLIVAAYNLAQLEIYGKKINN